MKRKIILIIALFAVILTMAKLINHYKYSQVFGDLVIVHYIAGYGDNLDYLTIHLNVILPEEKYYGKLTMNLIRAYVIIRHEKIPNYIEIILYDNIERLRDGDSYARTTFKK